MLFSEKELQNIIDEYHIDITGVFHIGAHDCEEFILYCNIGILSRNMIWIDAVESKVLQATQIGIPNVYHAVITDKDDEIVNFNISNNIQSSSILDFKTHLQHYPDIQYIQTVQRNSITVDTFFERNNIEPSKYNLWNFDIQGAELMALKGAENALQYAKILYLEVNEAELYEGCAHISEIDFFLHGHGFTRVQTRMTCQGWGDAIYIRMSETNPSTSGLK